MTFRHLRQHSRGLETSPMARGHTRQKPADDRQDPGANGANGDGPVKSEFAPDLGVDGTEVEIAPDQAVEQARHDLAQHEQVVEMGEVCGAAAHDSVAAMTDDDPAETDEWLESLDYVLQSKGRDRVKYLLSLLGRAGVPLGRRDPVLGHDAVHQHDSARRAAGLSRQSRD